MVFFSSFLHADLEPIVCRLLLFSFYVTFAYCKSSGGFRCVGGNLVDFELPPFCAVFFLMLEDNMVAHFGQFYFST